MNTAEARAVAERAARTSYGRLIALLAAPTGDLALAEDALAAAFEQALLSWPETGAPRNPDGWLLTVARNRQRDVWKAAARRSWAPLEAVTDGSTGATDPLAELDLDTLGERRLELMFVCAHPAIDAGIRTPLMLQVVLGFPAARIAAAFALPAAGLAQRLVRAKARIRDARIPFAVPDRAAMPARLPPVLEAVYGCYAMTGPTADPRAPESLAGEAQYLAVTLAALLEDEPEAWALAALITLSLARAPGRGDSFVPLDEQDPGRWDRALIAEGKGYLQRASATGRVGRFQLEAAIQAVHADRARTGLTDWAALRTLYDALVAVAPSLGAWAARAAVVGRLDGPEAGLAALNATRTAGIIFQPYWAVRAHLLAEAGRTAEAATAYGTAVELTEEAAVREHLERRWRQVLGRG